jgi:hypothetical protein
MNREHEIKITNPLIRPGSKIFLTFVDAAHGRWKPDEGITLALTDVKDGQAMVHLTLGRHLCLHNDSIQYLILNAE